MQQDKHTWVSQTTQITWYCTLDRPLYVIHLNQVIVVISRDFRLVKISLLKCDKNKQVLCKQLVGFYFLVFTKFLNVCSTMSQNNSNIHLHATIITLFLITDESV